MPGSAAVSRSAPPPGRLLDGELAPDGANVGNPAARSLGVVRWVVSFSPESLASLLRRHPQKLRARRRLLACQRAGTASCFPEACRSRLHDLCLEVEALERGLVGFLERRIPSRAARQRLRGRWRCVREANAVQLGLLEAWARGGVVDAALLGEAAHAIRVERRELSLFVRDLEPRVRPQLRVVRRGGCGATAGRALEGSAIPVRIDPATHLPSPLCYHAIGSFGSWRRALAYRGLYRSYRRALVEDCGLLLPWGADRIVAPLGGNWEAYVATARPRPCAAAVLPALSDADAVTLGRVLVGELARVWRRRPLPGDGGLHVAVAGRLEHWAIDGFDPEAPELSSSDRLLYLSAHLPLLRRAGRPLLDTRVLTGRAPWPAALALTPLLQTELGRQHRMRHVLIDALTSFEGRPSVQTAVLETVNQAIEEELEPWVDRTIHVDDVRERQRQHAQLVRLLASLDHVGGFLDQWHQGREPGLVEAARKLYGILAQPGVPPTRG